jgi:parallel beta-helix repeat protein
LLPASQSFNESYSVMLINWLNRILGNSVFNSNATRRPRRLGQSNGVRAKQAEVLESRTLLTLFVIDTLTDGANDANGSSDGLVSLREAITAANSNSVFGDAPAGSADGDFIVFQNALLGDTLTLGNGEFSINDDLSIFTGGASSLTIDAGGLSRIFHIDTTGFAGGSHNISISGLSLINGETANDGGALMIADGEHVSLSAMSISSSHAAGSGGGVYAGNGVLNLTGVTLDSNSASGVLASQGGGAIFNHGGTLTIDGTTSLVIISNNSADGTAGSGGGIFSTAGTVSITSANLAFNDANRAGGGIEVIDGTVSLTNVNLINNDAGSAAPAPGNGGGFHATGTANVMISGGSVFGNVASREGGGLWNSTGTMTVSKGTLIQGNTASGDAVDDGGGGIFNNGGTVIVDGSLAPVVITSNYADGILGSGGGIFNNVGTITVQDSEITANEAERAGGGIEDRNSTGTAITLTDVILDGNIVHGTDVTAPGNGGGLHVTGSGGVLISGGTVSGNTAALEGGGLWNGLGTMTINNGTIIDSNTASGAAADDGGGGIFNNGGTLTIDGTTSLVTISNNSADGTAGSGGGIFSTAGTVSITSANLAFNDANRAGGGIEVIDGTVSLTNVNLINNDAGSAAPAPGNGGGFHATGTANVMISGGSVFGNVASREGGGLWNSTGTMTVSKGTLIQGNTASGDAVDDGGGGIFNNGGTVIVDGSLAPVVITSNYADGILGSGGGIFNNVGTITVQDSEITANEAERAGGGIEDRNSTGTAITLTDVILDGNIVHGTDVTAPGNGGGLHVTGSGGVLISGGTVSGNTAALEGGGLWNGLGIMTINNGTVIDSNTASGVALDDGGGGIFNNGGTLTIDGTTSLVTISNNSADGTAGSGGGIFSTAGTVSITSANLTFNDANRAGGGIEVIDGTVSLTNVNLINNDAGSAAPAPGNGGGFHATGTANVMISGGSVFGNVASREGGGLWNSTGTMTVSNGTLIQGNTASGDAADDGGGGIFNNGGTVDISSATITSNYADGISGSGGGIFNFGGMLNVDGSTISDNSASRAGGGIEVTASSTTTITTSTISDNLTESNPGNGGGLHITAAGNVTIINATISGNTASNEGGGLWNSSTGTLTVRNTTITGNVSTAAGNGGGIKNIGGSTSLTNVIVAGNVSGLASLADDISGPISVGSASNLIGDAVTSGGLTDGVNANIVGISGSGTRPIAQILDPMLSDNGGPALTHMLVVGSLAIDAGTSLVGLGVTADQRGISRPKNAAFDIGAIEVELAKITGRKWLDANGDGVRLPKSLVDLGFFAQSGKNYFDQYGGNEKWVRAANLDWYFITPDGVLTKWDRTPFMLTGTVVTQLPTRFYTDEYLLIESTNEAFLNGWTFELVDSSGNVVSTMMTADVDLNNNSSIDPETERGVYEFTVLISGTYTVREVQQSGYSQSAGPSSVDAQRAYDLDQLLTLVYTGDYFTNTGGRGENWLRQSTGWIYILPDGSVYSWDGVSGGSRGLVNGTFIEKLDPSFHTNPQLLSEAVNPQIAVVAGTVATVPAFGNYIPISISGRVFQDTNQNGVRGTNEPYRNDRLIQLIDRDSRIVQQVRSMDLESNGTAGIDPNTERGIYQFTNVVPGRYTVRQVLENGEIETAPFKSQFAQLAYRVDTQLGLKFTGNYFESFGTNKERFLYSTSLKGWVYITKNGDLFKWNPSSGPAPKPLAGTLIARFDATYYNDPSKLFNAPATSVTLSSGGTKLNYDLGFYTIDEVFGDSGLFG